MKKLLVAMLVAVLCVPALADVDVTLADNGDLSFNILLNTNGEAVRGLALKVVCNGAGQALDIDGSSFAEFNTCIDYAYSTTGYDVGMTGQHPFALDGDPGVAADGATTFVVSMGYLDQSEGQLPYSNTSATVIATVKVGAAGEVCVTEDALRGGIVGDAALTVNMPDCITLDPGETCEDMFTGDELAKYQAYVANGMDPSCWCNQYQCHGDADNGTEQFGPFFYRVYTNDLGALSDAWKAQVTDANADPCADFSHGSEQFGPFFYTVYTDDLGILSTNWKAQDSALADCPSYIAVP